MVIIVGVSFCFAVKHGDNGIAFDKKYYLKGAIL
jgi:hypothetical protein